MKKERVYFIAFIFFCFLILHLSLLFILLPVFYKIILHPDITTYSGFIKIFIYYGIINSIILSILVFYVSYKIFIKRLSRYEELFTYLYSLNQNDLNSSFANNPNPNLDKIEVFKDKIYDLRVQNEVLKGKLKKLENTLEWSHQTVFTGKIISSLAHELKSPISALKGYAEILKEEGSKDVTEKIASTITRIERILNDLTGALKYSEKKSEEIFVPYEVIKKCINDFLTSGIIKEDVITLDIDEGIKLRGDPELFYRIFSNLISNAADAGDKIFVGFRRTNFSELVDYFSPEEGIEKLRLKEGEEVAKLTVKDNGKGIENNKITKIFEPFYTSKRGEGMGLGLFVVSQCVKSFHGRIFVKSEKNKGTEFKIYLPIEN